MSHQRKHRCCRRTGRLFEVGSGAPPTPVSVTTKKAIGKIVEQPPVARRRERRETTVANHLGGDSLGDFLRPVLEHLKIRMAMRVDKARRYRQPATVDHTGVNVRLENADHLYGRPGDRDVT